jgi:hypothetical protein
MMLVCGDVYELEVKKVNGSNPPIDGGVRLAVGVTEHTSNKGSIHLDNEVAGADEIKTEGTQCPKEAVEFELGLGVSRLTFAS